MASPRAGVLGLFLAIESYLSPLQLLLYELSSYPKQAAWVHIPAPLCTAVVCGKIPNLNDQELKGPARIASCAQQVVSHEVLVFSKVYPNLQVNRQIKISVSDLT